MFVCLLRGKIVKHQLSVAGLDEAEAFGDVELMAEFSLLSVVQNLQQGKMGPNLLETLEVLIPDHVRTTELQILQNKAAKAMLGQPPRSSSTEALKSLDLKSLSTRRFFHRCIAIHKCLIGETDFNFNFTKTQAVHSYNTRRSNDIRLPLPRTNWGKQTFIFHAAKDWNSLPNDLKECNILSIFKSKLKTFLKDLS